MAPSVIRLFIRRSATSGGAQASWLAWPTLSCGGGGQITTAGVNHHERELRGVAARAGRPVMAELRVETRGRYAGAVRVHVEGTELDSIPHAIEEAGFSDHARGSAASCGSRTSSLITVSSCPLAGRTVTSDRPGSSLESRIDTIS
jgi:hypothetical protein